MKETTAQRFGFGKSFQSPSAAAAVLGAALLASGTTDDAETAWSPSAACLLPDVLPVAGTLLSYGGNRQLAAGGTVTHSGDVIMTGSANGIYLNPENVNKGLIYFSAGQNRLNGISSVPWVVESDAGFKVRNTANSADAPLTCGAITASGNVQIGTSNGVYKLTVNRGIADGVSTPVLELMHDRDNAVQSNRGGLLQFTPARPGAWNAISTTYWGSPVEARLVLSAYNISNHLVLHESGRVGIGMVPTAAALEVNGAITASGEILGQSTSSAAPLMTLKRTGGTTPLLQVIADNVYENAGWVGILNSVWFEKYANSTWMSSVQHSGYRQWDIAVGTKLIFNNGTEIGWDSTKTYAIGSADMKFYPNAAGQLDLRADNGFRIRNLANSADAALTCGAITASAAVTSPGVVLTGTAGAPDIRTVTDNVHLRLMTNGPYNLGVKITSYTFEPLDSNYGLGNANNGWAFNYIGAGSAVGMITGALDTVKIRNRLNSADGTLTCGAITASGFSTVAQTGASGTSIAASGQVTTTFNTALVTTAHRLVGSDGTTYVTLGGGGVYCQGSWVGIDVVGGTTGRVNVGAGQMHITHDSGNRSLIKTYGNLELSPGALGGGGTYVEINNGTAGTYRDLLCRAIAASGQVTSPLITTTTSYLAIADRSYPGWAYEGIFLRRSLVDVRAGASSVVGWTASDDSYNNAFDLVVGRDSSNTLGIYTSAARSTKAALTCGAITASGTPTFTSEVILNGGIVINSSSYQYKHLGTGMAAFLLNSAGNYGKIQNDGAGKFSLAYHASGGVTLGTPVLTWVDTGRVGINNSSPSAALDVTGAITASGVIYSATQINVGGSSSSGIEHWTSGNRTGIRNFATYAGGELVGIGNNWRIGFSSSDAVTCDSSISRQSAGVLQIGTTAANALGSLACSAITASGAVTAVANDFYVSDLGTYYFSNASRNRGILITSGGGGRIGFKAGGTEWLQISDAGAITASGAIQETPTQSALDPTTTNIPSGKRQGWYNSTLAEFRDWVNIGGTLLKSAAYT